MYPLLSLSQISVDAELARRLPRRLAYYHLALPIAQDEEDITVAMASPENLRVVEVIQVALGVPVTPVRSPADDIRCALDNIWADEGEARQSGVMAWAESPHEEAVLEGYSRNLMPALSLGEPLSISQAPLVDFVAAVNASRPMLAVCAVTDLEKCRTLISSLSTSLLLLRGAYAPPLSILHALRGHSPDQRALDWVIPLAQYYEAQITLLAAANSIGARKGSPLMSDIARLILPEHPAQVIEYGRMLASMNLSGRIKVADGSLEDALVGLVETEPFDMVVIATESNGKFVQSILERLSHNSTAFLVIKP